MADTPKRTVTVRVREIVEDVKSGMMRDELVRKHRISPRALAKVTEKILRAGYVSRSDLHFSLVSGIRTERLAKASGLSRASGKFTLRLPESLLQSLSDKENVPDSPNSAMSGSLPSRSALTSIILNAVYENLPNEQELLERIEHALVKVIPSERSIGSRVHDAVKGAMPNDDLIRKELRTALIEQLPAKEEILHAIASSFVSVLPDPEEMVKRVVSHVTGSFPSNKKMSGRVDDFVERALPSRAELFQAIDAKLSALIPDSEAAEEVLGGALAAFETVDRVRDKADKVLADVSELESIIDKLSEATQAILASDEVISRSQGNIAQDPSSFTRTSASHESSGPEARVARSADVLFFGTQSEPAAQGGHQVGLSLDDMGMLDFDEDEGFEPTIELNVGTYRTWNAISGSSGDGDHDFSEPPERSALPHSVPDSSKRNLRDTVTIDIGADDSALHREPLEPVQLKQDTDEIDLTMSMEGDSIYSEVGAASKDNGGGAEGDTDGSRGYGAASDTGAVGTRELESTLATPRSTTRSSKTESDRAIEGIGMDDFSDDDIPTEELPLGEFSVFRPVVSKTPEPDSGSSIDLIRGDSPEEWVQELDGQLPPPPSSEVEADERMSDDEKVDPESLH